jgi:hypothetical protein
MSNKELSKEESLALITNMIGQAKRNVAKGGSFYFLLWGWVVMLANLGHYLIDKYDWYEAPYIVWIITIPAGIASMIYGARRGNEAGVKSHLDRMYGLVWLGVFISVMTIIFFTGDSSTNLNAIILTFAGLGTFISGCMLRFSPLVMGGVALWFASIIAFNLPITDQYLVGAIGILAGYLIPGYLLKRVER